MGHQPRHGHVDGSRLIDPGPITSLKACQEVLHERVLRRAASEKPILVALEDLHWAGDPSRSFLEYLVPRLKTTPAPVLIVATFRADAPEMENWEPVLKRLEAFEPDPFHHVMLSGLDEDLSRKLVRSMLKPTSRLQDNIIQLTSGNPLHIIQVLRFLEDSDLLHERNGVWDIRPGQHVREIVPPALADLLLARLKRSFADHPAQEDLARIIYRCAMVGRRIPYRLLQEFLEIEVKLRPRLASMMDHLEEALDFYLDAGILLEDPDSNEDILEFCHGLLRETLFQQLKGRRGARSSHQAAAKAKVRYYGKARDAHADAIADHYEEARDWLNALEWHVRAGDVARKSWDLRACEARYLHGQELMWQLSKIDPEKQRRISEGLGDLCYIDGRYDEASAHFAKAFDSAEAAGEGQAMAHILFRQDNVGYTRIIHFVLEVLNCPIG